MKGTTNFLCLLLIGLTAAMGYYSFQTEMHAQRWTKQASALQRVEILNATIAKSHDLNQDMHEAIRMLVAENGLLCERDAKMTQVVAEFEAENRALKNSLAEAVDNLEDQRNQINNLIRENNNLKWKVSTLEEAIERIPEPKSEGIMKSARDVVYAIDVVTTVVPMLMR